jgi:ribonuclease Y
MEIILPIVLAIVGLGVGGGGTYVYTKRTGGKAAEEAKKELQKAKKEAAETIRKAEEDAARRIEEVRKDEQKRRSELKEIEQRVINREESLDKKLDELDKRSENLRKSESEVEDLKNEIRDIRGKQQEKLEKIAKLTKAEASEKLLQMTERDIRNDLLGLVNKLQNEAKENAEEQSGVILATVMERMASEVTAERTVTAIKLEDGRVHPGRIEEVVEKAQKQVQKDVVRAGEDAAREVGLVGIPKEILQLLGELKYRTSYGQNVLKHSVEMAQLAGVLAEELGANVKTAKYAALTHDMGKALSHKVEGKHHHITGEMLRKYGAPEEVALAAEQHHDDMDATTVEALIVRVVDAISGARPGARSVSAENFAERMKDLENTALSFDGIEKAYAISAGREVRVFVQPKSIDDLQAIRLARDIANKIESTMQYPGTIKVNVIRETRAIEFAK